MKSSKNLLFFFSIIYLQTFFAQGQGFHCGSNESILSDSTIKAMQMTPLWLKQKQARKSSNDIYVCRLAIDIDSDTYFLYNKDTSYIKYEVVKMIDRVSKVYEEEIGTKLVVSVINIWKDSKTDPYKGTSNIFQLLNILSSTWQKTPYKSLPFDKAMYLPTKPFDGAGGVASGIGSVFNVSPWGVDFTIAHELGHNFGSPHTQSCLWPGGMLDFCYSAEGDCYEEALEYVNGTIMSYCGVKFSFHPLCQALMLNHAEKNFKKIDKIESAPLLPNNTNLSGKPYLVFNPSILAESYDFQIAQSADFIKNLFIDSTKINAIRYASFKKNITYFIRVRSKNRISTSAWSNIVSVIVPDTALTAPILKTPLNNVTEIDATKDLKLTFDHVEGATQYELEIASYYDFGFQSTQSPNPIPLSSTNSFTININKLGYGYKSIFWRVRAVNGLTKSAWSESRRAILGISQSSVAIPFYDSNFAPTSFPASFNSPYEFYNTKFTVSQNSDFSNLSFEQTVKPNQLYTSAFTVNIEKLLPNTQYYLKVEVINPKADLSYDIPSGILGTVIKPFRTQTETFLPGWTLFNSSNTPSIGGGLGVILKNGTNIFASTTKGLVKVSSDSLNFQLLNRENTKGTHGGTSNLMGIDSLGNLWRIVKISKRKLYEGVFPTTVYALRQFDGKTMKLISSQEFQLDNTFKNISFFDANNRFISDGQNVAKIDGNNVKTFLTFEQRHYEMIGSKSFLWFKAYNSSTRKDEISTYNLQTKEIKLIALPAQNTNNNTVIMKVDRNENLWINMNPSGFAKFNGETWTSYNASNSPLLPYITTFDIDQFNNVYVYSYRSYPFYTLFKFNGKIWKDIRQTGYFGSPLVCDGLGKLWLNVPGSTLAYINPCQQIPKPTITSSSTVLDYGKKITLEAKGCNNVVWNWKNTEENMYEKLILNLNNVEVSPKSSTTYTARCFDDGCSGQESNFNLNVQPILFANKVEKTQYCQNDTLRIYPKIEGTFDNNNQLTASLVSSKVTFEFPLINNKKNYFLLTNPKISSGKYWLKIQGTLPKVVSKDSIEITIIALPTVSITGLNNFCEGEGITLNASSNAVKAAFQWTKDKVNFAKSSTLNVTNAGVYSVSVTDSNGCFSRSSDFQIIKNKLPSTSITGNNSFCVGQSTILTSVTQEGSSPYSYQWKQDSIKIGTNSNRITVQKAGVIKVEVTDSKGCKITSSDYKVTQNEYPIVTITKDGTTDILQNTSVTLSIPLVNGQTIQWNKDGVPITSATNNSFLVSVPGKYTVTVTLNNCTTLSDIISVNLITSNEPNVLDSMGLRVFPNPTNGCFIIEFNSSDLRPNELTISDALGRLIVKKTIKTIGEFSQEFNISEYPKGVYLIGMQKDNIKNVIKITLR